MNTIAATLESLSLGQATRFLNLTVFPLVGATGYERDYRSLHDAVRAGTACVREVSEGGSVPELTLENAGKQPVLVLEGEELVGAKQNRTANATILAPAGKIVRIPVTCVESGRWEYRTREFEPSEQIHFARGRVNKMASVSTSMQQAGTRSADQADVWHDIAEKSSRMHVAAPTSAMTDVFEAHRSRLDDYVGAFRAAPQQTGAVFALGERIEGLELFDCPQTLAEMLPRLIRSYAIDAIESVGSSERSPTPESAEDLIRRLQRAEFERYPAIGEGTEVRLSTPRVIGAGLLAQGRVVHLVAFAVPTTAGRGEPDAGGFTRMERRRREMRR
ncbi:MAG: hypothetical protein CL908_09740 [Deltaproteobacteria bacterium]|nr:hypothetical protein [Deltaproteobacteria bacterium]